jgi:phosphatidylglycerol:prolipoprotein diacylglycerol transferase
MVGYLAFPDWLRPEIIPGLPIRWYGLMYLVAFAITCRLFLRMAVKEGALDVDRDTVLNLFFWGIIGVLIGGRLFSVLIYDPTGHYLRNPLQIIVPFQRIGERTVFTGLQGMSYHGGLVGALVAVLLYSRRKGLNVLRVADMIAVSAPLGYTFGRLGNFINGELYGRVTDSPIGMVFPQALQNNDGQQVRLDWVREMADAIGMEIADGVQRINLPRYPSQLFEAFFEGVFLWLILWFVLRKRSPFPGFLLGAYLIGYGLARFMVEYLREPDRGLGFPIELGAQAAPGAFSWLNFSTGQILSALMIAGGILALVLFNALARRTATDPVAKGDTTASGVGSQKRRVRSTLRRKKLH